MNENQENISIPPIIELLKTTTDDGTFSGVLYDLYLFIGIAKGIDDIKNDRGMPLEKFTKEREALYVLYL